MNISRSYSYVKEYKHKFNLSSSSSFISQLKREALIATFQHDNGKRARQEDPTSNEPTSHDEGPSHAVHDQPRPSTPLLSRTASTKPPSSMSVDNKKIASLKKSNRRLRRKVVELKQINKELKCVRTKFNLES